MLSKHTQWQDLPYVCEFPARKCENVCCAVSPLKKKKSVTSRLLAGCSLLKHNSHSKHPPCHHSLSCSLHSRTHFHHYNGSFTFLFLPVLPPPASCTSHFQKLLSTTPESMATIIKKKKDMMVWNVAGQKVLGMSMTALSYEAWCMVETARWHAHNLAIEIATIFYITAHLLLKKLLFLTFNTFR